MTRINPADQILIMLRAQLEHAAKTKRASPQAPRTSSRSKRAFLERIRDTLATGEAPPQELRRALVSALLVEEFGETTLNDPQFQNLVDRVMSTIQRDQEANIVLENAFNSMKSSG
ncbi:hypothetical protein [Vitreimonas flagellata]|uniref:hypothetical protein n=1 Tax=Vitreimonas flagellata TaxID=2560861 RepID=UPI001074C578|nr:hypothetical protein [Vitreimonas flagellata]